MNEFSSFSNPYCDWSQVKNVLLSLPYLKSFRDSSLPWGMTSPAFQSGGPGPLRQVSPPLTPRPPAGLHIKRLLCSYFSVSIQTFPLPGMLFFIITSHLEVWLFVFSKGLSIWIMSELKKGKL